MPNVTRGGDMRGLLQYLADPGRHDEHQRPRLVAGDRVVTDDYLPGVDLTHIDARRIARLLDRPRRVFGIEVLAPNYLRDEHGRPLEDPHGRKIKDPDNPLKPGHVWHCSLSLRSSEGQLSDGNGPRLPPGSPMGWG